MYLKYIRMQNFRNYEDVSWAPSEELNLIAGDNAQGKTNLLEAIYLGTCFRSFRTNRLSEIIKWDKNKTLLDFSFFAYNSIYNTNFKIEKESKKEIKVNNKNLHSNDTTPYLAAVVFIPEDLDIIKSSPSRRRKFIDTELGILDGSYYYYFRQYQKILSERNNLLKSIKSNYYDENYIDVWNEQLLTLGTQLLIKRLNLLKKFVPLVKNVYKQLTGGKEVIDVRYLSSIGISDKLEDRDIKKRFSDELSSVKKDELFKGQTLKGPHRDDLLFYINSIDSKNYASRGQQRTIVLSLKLSLLHLWQQETGEYPVLLLDDVLQELDINKQEYLLNEIKGSVQTFLTSSMEREKQFKDINNKIKISEGMIY